MNEESESTNSALNDSIRDYVKVTSELYALKALDKSADMLSTLVARLAVIFFLALLLLFLSLGIAFWLGDIFGSTYLGFLAVAGFFALVALLLHLFKRTWIKEPLANNLIKSVTGKSE